jgi:hypothetical protein
LRILLTNLLLLAASSAAAGAALVAPVDEPYASWRAYAWNTGRIGAAALVLIWCLLLLWLELFRRHTVHVEVTAFWGSRITRSLHRKILVASSVTFTESFLYWAAATQHPAFDFRNGIYLPKAVGAVAAACGNQVVFGAVVILCVASSVRAVRAHAISLRVGRCPTCGYDLTGCSGRCPECGTTCSSAPSRRS